MPRPKPVRAGAIHFSSPRLARLNVSSRRLNLASLHLSRRAINALQSKGILSIGGLIAQAEKGILHLRAAGVLTVLEITDALEALSNSLVESGGIDWVGFAERRGFTLLPRVYRPSYSGKDFLRHFSEACGEAVAGKFGQRGQMILRKRIFHAPEASVSLVEIGTELGLSGEMVRLIERSITKMLRRAIWDAEYRGCRFRLRPELLQPLHAIRGALDKVPEGCLDFNRWRFLLRSCADIEPQDLGEQTSFIIQLLGLKGGLLRGLPVLPTRRAPADALKEAIDEMTRLFAGRGGKALSERQVLEHLQASLPERCLSERVLTSILHSLPLVERVRNKQYRIRFADLPDHAARWERILDDRGSPIHFREIYSEIMRLAPATLREVSPSRLAARMGHFKRFVSVGRTGLWALREWSNVETRTVAEIAAALLASSAQPLHEREIFEAIVPMRSVRRKSIGTLLHEDGRFYRVAPAVWRLVE